MQREGGRGDPLDVSPYPFAAAEALVVHGMERYALDRGGSLVWFWVMIRTRARVRIDQSQQQGQGRG